MSRFQLFFHALKMIVFCLGLLFPLNGCVNLQPDFSYKGEKMKGISFVAPRNPVDSTAFLAIKQVNADWVSVMPYGFLKSDSGDFYYSKNSKKMGQWWGEREDGVAESVRMAHEAGLKVMIKPHVWLGWNEFTGHLDLKTEAAWQKFEAGYRDYVLGFARLADSLNAEAFCLATEMEKPVAERPAYWHGLIKDIRRVYHGKLTYAENWDAYQKVPFWQELDFIGIDAYFPLSNAANPALAEICEGWENHLKAIGKFANQQQLPVLFTEIGYRSCDYSLEKPWEVSNELPPNEVLQAEAYRAMFKEVWPQPWFAGAFIWKWFPDHDPHHEQRDKFTPQAKMAEKVLTDAFDAL